MERRIKGIKANGTAGEIEVFDGLSHGFGLGEGTAAEGSTGRRRFGRRTRNNKVYTFRLIQDNQK